MTDRAEAPEPARNTADGPVRDAERITLLDTLRGVAVLAILVMNAVSFGLPTAAYFNISAAGNVSPLDWALAVTGEVFVDQKAMAMFSLLFGAGIVMFADRAEAKGRAPFRLSLWRNLLLFGIGFVHGMLWDGDILVVYALCAPVLLALRSAGVKTLLLSGASLLALSGVLAVAAQNTVGPEGAALGYYWFPDALDIGDGVGLFLIADFFLRALGMMLVGVALYRMGWVQGRATAAQYRALALGGLALGLPLAVLGVLWQFSADFAPRVAVVSAAPNTLATLPIALGYLGLVALWDLRPAGAFMRRIRAVGRMALTNYLTQTLLGFALLRGVFGDTELRRSEIWLFILGVWAFQLWWSQAWLARYRFGPFEWAWRCATYRAIQPLRRIATSSRPRS